MRFSYFAVNKPYGYLSQFSGEENDLLLGQLFNFPKDVYPIGRLDKDSEGLLLLTNDNNLKSTLLEPKNDHTKTYLVQVEGDISSKAIEKLKSGEIIIKHNGSSYKVRKAQCRKVESPDVEERNPPIRFRANIPTSWIELTITEGKNRQVRKMTAAVGHPTLRLIRIAIGNYRINNLNSGQVRELSSADLQQLLS
jgi:23S rRNA pseudouridine2457 synthase